MRKVLLFTIFLSVLGLIIIIPGKKWARNHVNYQTATTDHPLLCTNCHLYIHKDNLPSKFLNKDYYSPLNLEISNDSKLVYVVAQDANELLIADAASGRILHKIPVGKHPHSVIVDKENKRAYVSNQWSDNVSVIDLNTFESYRYSYNSKRTCRSLA